MTVYLSLEHQPQEIGDYQLQWEVSKERWQKLQQMPLPWLICLSPDKLIILEK